MTRIVLATLTLGVLAPTASAVITVLLWDPIDDPGLIQAAAEDPAVQAFRADLDRFTNRLMARDQPAIERLLGKASSQGVGTSFAMPVGQYRGFSMSGLRSADKSQNKDHTEFHLVGDVGAVEVWYGIDGQTPVAAVVYLAVDGAFPKLTTRNLARRLVWDRWHFRELVRVIADQGRETADEWRFDLPDATEQPTPEVSGWSRAGAAVLIAAMLAGWFAWARRRDTRA